MRPILLSVALFISLLIASALKAQNPYHLIDARGIDATSDKCADIINSKPPEVLFGLDINPSGEVYFSISSKQWFDKIFSIANCISADIVSKERYDCNKTINTEGLFKGYVLQPFNLADFKKNNVPTGDGSVTIKIGTLPLAMINKQLEANLVIIVSNRKICYYSNFVNIDRAVWSLLPMGLYTDTLIESMGKDEVALTNIFTYSRKIQCIVPFAKGKATISGNDIKSLYDSLNLKGYNIKKLDITAYSSVEGSLLINEDIMKKRVEAMVAALKNLEPSMQKAKIITAENWLEFFHDIKSTPFEYLSTLSKREIKIKLLDKAIAVQLEPILAKHRKALVTIYVAEKSAAANLSADVIMQGFSTAVANKKIQEARVIQKEIIERIADNKLPLSYLHNLEVPVQKDYSELINDREIYKYQLQLTTEYEALQVFEELRKADPASGKILYNICALTLQQWHNGDDSTNTKKLLSDINLLTEKKIDSSLVKRMLVNYYILKCDEYMRHDNYAAKDQVLLYIKNEYSHLKLTDEDRYALAKYFTFYSHEDWALQIITPRIGQVNVSEDIVFYYLNLLFFRPAEYETDDFENAVLNAINLNTKRFCHFFDPIDKGGASMQLLEYDELKKVYCENCSN